MRDEIIKLKGSRQGLVLVFDKGTAFSKVFNEIKGKLEAGSNFFQRGTLIYIQPGLLSDPEMAKLRRLFNQHGIVFRQAPAAPPPPPKTEEVPPPPPSEKPEEPREAPEQRMVVVNRTIRSGQVIKSDGGVLVCGNVNPGAEIIASGSVDIRGKCRGSVHAGAKGDTTAVIIADRMMPVQLRIAGLDFDTSTLKKSALAERAFVRDGRIVVEPIER